MRSSRPALLAASVAALATLSAACSPLGSGPGDAGASEPGASASAGDPGDSARGRACAEVRAGIDAFNAGEFEETVARFEAAVPLAEELAGDDPSRRDALLLEAVRWYAELSPGDYPEASRSSERFARYQRITLSQCVVGAPEEEEDESPGTVVA